MLSGSILTAVPDTFRAASRPQERVHGNFTCVEKRRAFDFIRFTSFFPDGTNQK